MHSGRGQGQDRTESGSEPANPYRGHTALVSVAVCTRDTCTHCCACHVTCDGLGLLYSNVRVCSVVGVSRCEILPRSKISNTNEQLDRVWRHSLFQKSGPRA